MPKYIVTNAPAPLDWAPRTGQPLLASRRPPQAGGQRGLGTGRAGLLVRRDGRLAATDGWPR